VAARRGGGGPQRRGDPGVTQVSVEPRAVVARERAPREWVRELAAGGRQQVPRERRAVAPARGVVVVLLVVLAAFAAAVAARRGVVAVVVVIAVACREREREGRPRELAQRLRC